MTLVTYNPADCELAEHCAERYEESEQFTADAIEFVSVAGELPADLVIAIEQWYRTTSEFDTKIDDLVDGDPDAWAAL